MSSPRSPWLTSDLNLETIDLDLIVDDQTGNTWLHDAVLLANADKSAEARVQELITFGFDIDHINKYQKTPFALANNVELKKEMERWSTDTKAQLGRAALNQKIIDHQWKNEMRRQWNGVLSFMAGLTIIYPIARTAQYFWKLKIKPAFQRWWKNRSKKTPPSNNPETTSPTVVPEVSEPALAPNYTTWAMYYERGLAGKWGTKHSEKEIKKAIPKEYNKVLRAYKHK